VKIVEIFYEQALEYVLLVIAIIIMNNIRLTKSMIEEYKIEKRKTIL